MQKIGNFATILNNASSNGGKITTKIKFNPLKKPNLSKYQYKIDFASSQSEKPVINLKDKWVSGILPSAFMLYRNEFIKLIAEDQSIRNQILNISGKDADKITSDVLRDEIFIRSATWPNEANDNDGTLELELQLSIGNDNSKKFIFTGFDKFKF